MFAVVQTGGKQYRVAVGQSIQVEKLPQAKGESFEFDRVLFVGEGDQVTAGTPLVEGARVVATVSRQERGPKILVFRYKSKKRVRVTKGHRQNLTRVFIRDIVVNGESAAERERAQAAVEQPTAQSAPAEPTQAATASAAAEQPAAAAAPVEPAASEEQTPTTDASAASGAATPPTSTEEGA